MMILRSSYSKIKVRSEHNEVRLMDITNKILDMAVIFDGVIKINEIKLMNEQRRCRDAVVTQCWTLIGRH